MDEDDRGRGMVEERTRGGDGIQPGMEGIKRVELDTVSETAGLPGVT